MTVFLKTVTVECDYQKAYDLYQMSAARGDIICLPAIMALGNIFEQGLGVDKDIEEALVWYQKGADLGDVAAQKKVSELKQLLRRLPIIRLIKEPID